MELELSEACALKSREYVDTPAADFFILDCRSTGLGGGGLEQGGPRGFDSEPQLLNQRSVLDGCSPYKLPVSCLFQTRMEKLSIEPNTTKLNKRYSTFASVHRPCLHVDQRTNLSTGFPPC